MPVEIDSQSDDLDDVASKLKDEFEESDDVRAVAVQVTGPGFVTGGFDREGWMFTDLIGAIETQKQRMVDEHF